MDSSIVTGRNLGYIKTSTILCLFNTPPVVIEIVDSRKKLEQFFERIDPVLGEGMAMLERLQARGRRRKPPGMLPVLPPPPAEQNSGAGC